MNEEQFFLINRGDLEYRLDPEYYHIERRKAIERIESSGNRILPLKYVVSFPRIILSENPRSLKYVGLEDIESNTGKYLDLTDKTSFGSALYFKPNDILFPKLRPYLNKVHLSTFEGIGSTEFVVLQSKLVSPKFLTAFLSSSIVVNQTKHMMSGNTLPRLQTEDINNLPIPICDESTQNKVETLLEDSFSRKNEKEYLARNILNKIDTYILEQIGVTLPIQPLNTIENRIFKTGWQKVTGNRFDPKKYSQQSESLIACIENSMFRKVPLKSLVVHSVAGDWGLDEKEEVNPKLFTKCLVIRATEFDNNYNLNIENSRAKFRLISITKLKKLDIKPQDFLLEKSGGSPDQPVGRISILENELLENNTIAYSNFIHKFRVNTDEVLPEFLFCFLKTIHNIKLTDVMQSQTNGIRNLIMREYWNQSIILPDKKKQKEIADTIYQMRAEAKQTEIDAQQGFEQTKKEIEKLILE